MGWSVIFFFMTLALTALCLYTVIYSIRELRRFGELKGYTKFIIAGVFCIIFICYNPPHWVDTLDLNDSEIVTGVLEYQDGNFILTGSGDDYPDWDFSCCDSVSMVKLHCNGKEITVWHNNHVVYQVEKDGKILYGITRNNIGIVFHNLTYIMLYVMMCAFIVGVVMNCDLRLKELIEDEKRSKFEDRFVTEEKVRPVKDRSEPKALKQVIRNANTATVQTTPKQPPKIRPTMSNNAFYTSSDSGKILRRFCKHCGTELGETEEIRDSHGSLTDIVYHQYKFCPNCGMDSNPNMSVKAKEDDTETYIALIVVMFTFGAVPFALMIITVPTILIECLGITVVIFVIVWLFSEKFHDCPSCGRLYTKEHFCPNCGTELNKDE